MISGILMALPLTLLVVIGIGLMVKHDREMLKIFGTSTVLILIIYMGIFGIFRVLEEAKLISPPHNCHTQVEQR